MSKSGPTLPPSQTRQPLDVASELLDEETSATSNEPNVNDPPLANQATPRSQTELTMGIALLQAKVAESNDQLAKIVDSLDGVKQVLIRTQQNYAQGTRSFYYSCGYHLTANLETMNEAGQFPTAQGLPILTRDGDGLPRISQLSSNSLARYLQFYNLGGDLVHSGDTPTLRDEKRSDAEKCLSNYLNDRIRPI